MKELFGSDSSTPAPLPVYTNRQSPQESLNEVKAVNSQVSKKSARSLVICLSYPISILPAITQTVPETNMILLQ